MRPGRGTVAALELGDSLALAAGQIVDVDDGLLRLEGDVGQPLAVRRPGRRDDGFAGIECGLHVLAVPVGHIEPITIALLGDEGDAGGEDALDAGELLVDDVRDAVTGQAHVGLTGRHGGFGDDGLPHGVGQLVVEFQPGVGHGLHRTHQHRVGALAAQGRHVQRRVLAEGVGEVDQPEHAAALQVFLDDDVELLGGLSGAVEGGQGQRNLACADTAHVDAHRLGRQGTRHEEGGGKDAKVERASFHDLIMTQSCGP